ncbi:MAG: hypothetical protein ACKOAH_01855, partial [Pirellula sp.]
SYWPNTVVICMHMLKRPGSAPLNPGVLSTNRRNEQTIALKSPISHSLIVALLRRLDDRRRWRLSKKIPASHR